MYGFIDEHLDPEDWLGEIMFGVIMGLAFTGAVRVAGGSTTNWELFVEIACCSLAWAIIDGTMYAVLSYCERARKFRLLERVQLAESPEQALQQIAESLDERLSPLTTPEQRQTLYRQMISAAPQLPTPRPRLLAEDIKGGVAVALTLLLATIPVILPFLLFTDLRGAVRASNVIALLLLFCVGSWWGYVVAGTPWRVGFGMTLIGLVLVFVTILLGG